MARQFCRWDPSLKVVGLRFSNIMEPKDYARFPAFDSDPQIRMWNLWGYIDARDLDWALSEGWKDFKAERGDIVVLAVIYPLVGLIAAAAAFNAQVLPLFFPLIAGLTILGPAVASGFYEIARRRGLNASSPSIRSARWATPPARSDRSSGSPTSRWSAGWSC